MPKFLGVNKDFFKSWTHEMAYVLGFFTADGCLTINPRGSHYVEFNSNDLDILEKIKLVMGSSHKIGCRKRIDSQLPNSYRLQLGSKEIFNDLVKLEFTVNKSKTVKFPKISDEYFADYLRGYFDGDGCISYSNYFRKQRNKHFKYIVVMFTSGSKEFLIQLADIIRKEILIKSPKIIYHSRAYRLSYLSNNAVNILKYIYNNPVIYLDRKFKKSKLALQFMDR
ncbi:MAG: LAGLIDADG family homing endonuclease [bacterium]